VNLDFIGMRKCKALLTILVCIWMCSCAHRGGEYVRFSDNGSGKLRCYLTYDTVNADIDFLPDSKDIDSYSFALDTWSREELESEVEDYHRACNDVHLELDQINELFKGQDSVNVQIYQVVKRGKIKESTVAVYGRNSYCIFGYSQ